MVYRKTNAQNQPVGFDNDPAGPLAPGALQSFVLTFITDQQGASFTGGVQFVCNEATAPIRKNVNSFQLNIQSGVPDIIPVIATPTPGIAESTTPGQTAFFAAAAINIGGAGTIVVTPSTTLGDLQADANITVCETDASAACLAPPALSVTTTFGAGQTKTFSAFLTQPIGAGTPFMPDAVRVGLTFGQQTAACGAATTRGLATTAFRSPDPGLGSNLAFGFYRLIFDDGETRYRTKAEGYFFPSAGRLLAPMYRLDNLGSFIGYLDATAASSGAATVFQDARFGLYAPSGGALVGPANYSVLLGDFASTGFKFAGRMVAGSGSSPLPAGREADFRSMVNPFTGTGGIVKDNYSGVFQSTEVTVTLGVSPAGQPIPFSGQFISTTPGGATCPITGKLTPQFDASPVYLAELTLTIPVGATCQTTFPSAGTYDGVAQMLEPTAATTSCSGATVPARPRMVEMQMASLPRERRTDVPTAVFPGVFVTQAQ